MGREFTAKTRRTHTPKALQTLAGGKRSATTGHECKNPMHPEGMPDGKVMRDWHPFGMLPVRVLFTGGGAALTSG